MLYTVTKLTMFPKYLFVVSEAMPYKQKKYIEEKFVKIFDKKGDNSQKEDIIIRIKFLLVSR